MKPPLRLAAFLVLLSSASASHAQDMPPPPVFNYAPLPEPGWAPPPAFVPAPGWNAESDPISPDAYGTVLRDANGSIVHCTTQRFGDQVFTECR